MYEFQSRFQIMVRLLLFSMTLFQFVSFYCPKPIIEKEERHGSIYRDFTVD